MTLREKKPRSRPISSTRDLDTLVRFSRDLSGAQTLDDLLALALDAIIEYAHVASARIWIVDWKKRQLSFRAHRGLFPEIFSSTLEISFDETCSGRAALSAKMVRLRKRDMLPELGALGFVEFASIPLFGSARIIAVLDAAARHRAELNVRALKQIERMGRILSMAIEKFQLLSVAETRETELRRLWEAGLEVSNPQEYAQVLRTVVDRARELIGGESSALCVWDEQKRWWVVHGTSGASDAFEVSVKRIETVDHQQPVECPVVRFKYRQSHIDVPVMHNGQVIGCLCIANQHARDFSVREHELLSGLAAQAARAMDTARRLETAGTRATTVERERLAREMHDTLAQLLGFVNIKTLAAREFLVQGHPDQARAQLDQLAKLSQELYADTRELILGLRSETGPDRGLLPALTEYTRQFNEFTGIATSMKIDDMQEIKFAPAMEVQLVRVVQEALSNVRKHAAAHNALVHLQRNGDSARVEITDDGRGFDPSNLARSEFPRLGLTSMRERVESIGGTFMIESALGRGTKVQIEFPLVVHGEP